MATLTDADLTYFWLGPLGYLRQLPLLPLTTSHTASETIFGGLFEAVDGTGTLDILGLKRSWELDWVCLEADELAAVHAWFHRLNRAALRIIDPRAYNRLSRDGASGGSWSRGITAHTVTAGTRAFVAVTDYPADVLGLVDGGIAWSVPLNTAATLRIDATDKIPLIPGEQITLSVLLKGTLGAQVGVQFYDIAGAAGSTSLASSTTLAGWAWKSYTFTPSSTQVSASLIVVAASGAARTVTVGPAFWHPTNTTWTPGTGCPRVLIPTMTTRYPGLARQDPGITLREA
jgi:hypothetical protein